MIERVDTFGDLFYIRTAPEDDYSERIVLGAIDETVRDLAFDREGAAELGKLLIRFSETGKLEEE